jgi:hypothetical protein
MTRITNYLIAFGLIGSFVFLSSCGGDDPKPKTKTDLLSGVTWKMTRLKVGTLEGDPETCLTDDTYIYQADGVYKFSEGATKCDPADPSSINGTWEFKSNETKLAVSQTEAGITLTYNYTIVELTETKLRLKFDFLTDIEATYEPK